MAKSKKRGGEKQHRKRVSSRNKIMKAQITKQQKMFTQIMEETMKRMKEEQLSGDTNTSESFKLNTDGFIQSSEVL